MIDFSPCNLLEVSVLYFLLAKQDPPWALAVGGWGTSIPSFTRTGVSSGADSSRCRFLRGWIPRRMEMAAPLVAFSPSGSRPPLAEISRGHHHPRPRTTARGFKGHFDPGRNKTLSAAQGPAAMDGFRPGILTHSRPGRLTPLLSSLCSGYDYSWTRFFLGVWLCVWMG